MSDAAPSARPSAHAQIRLHEPGGERTFESQLTIGGERAQVVVPGSLADPVLRIERRDAVWSVQATGAAPAHLDGRALSGVSDLRQGDVLTVGEAQIVVVALSRTLLQLAVHHLIGNTTVAPTGSLVPAAPESDEDLEIAAILADSSPPREPGGAAARAAAGLDGARLIRWALIVAALGLIALTIAFISTFTPVTLDVSPSDARVRTADTWLAVRSGTVLYVRPGPHTLRAEREGYFPARADVTVEKGGHAAARLRLAKLPGRLRIDTHGVIAEVRIDGVAVARAPGGAEVPAGQRTVTVRAPRYFDYVAAVEVTGTGVRQDLDAPLKPSWGTVRVAANPPGVQLSVDGRELGTTPLAVELEEGVRLVRLSAPGLKTWESGVVVKAGETASLGPITLGQADAQLVVRSTPSGAEVAIARKFRGRTPLTLSLPSGIAHEIVVVLPGYESWRRSFLAEPGRKLTLDAVLQPILFKVNIQGEPADAEVFVDGTSKGPAPQSLQLLAVEHRIELRKPQFVSFITGVAPVTGLERTIQYHLTPTDPAAALLESAPTLTTKAGYVLRLVPRGTFMMGSDTREQGRRPNEGRRSVTLQRPFYLGATDVTNEQFRKFRPDHTSGYLEKEKRSFDLDAQPVTRVSWDDAAAYCNWLSEQEGVEAAYEQRGSTYVLKRPLTSGYRLPTEAEWEYAARYAGAGRTQRYAWGDELPVRGQIGNLAGAEASSLVPTVMQGYRDEFPSIAPVGKFPPSLLGLYDMTGNVSEWVNDYYMSFVDDAAATDPLGPDEGTRHVVRGANWQTASLSELRLAWRDGADSQGSQTIGFRVARYAP